MKEKIEILEIRDCKNSPFKTARIINGDNEEIVIICGKTKMNTEFKTLEEAEKWVAKKPWELIGMLTESLFNYLKK